MYRAALITSLGLAACYEPPRLLDCSSEGIVCTDEDRVQTGDDPGGGDDVAPPGDTSVGDLDVGDQAVPPGMLRFGNATPPRDTPVPTLVRVEGGCDGAGGAVEISGDTAGLLTLVCNAGSFAGVLELAAGVGPKSVVAEQRSEAGRLESDTRTWQLVDTLPRDVTSLLATQNCGSGLLTWTNPSGGGIAGKLVLRYAANDVGTYRPPLGSFASDTVVTAALPGGGRIESNSAGTSLQVSPLPPLPHDYVFVVMTHDNLGNWSQGVSAALTIPVAATPSTITGLTAPRAASASTGYPVSWDPTVPDLDYEVRTTLANCSTAPGLPSASESVVTVSAPSAMPIASGAVGHHNYLQVRAAADGACPAGDWNACVHVLSAGASGGLRVPRTLPGLKGNRTCVILNDDYAYCWGANNSGQAGVGNSDPIGETGDIAVEMSAAMLGDTHYVIELALGQAHTCARLEDNSLRCWGDGAKGQLGRGSTEVVGDASAELGNALPAVDTGGLVANQLVAGVAHTCGLFDDNSVRCWGDNQVGQLGEGSPGFQNRGDGPNEMGSALNPVLFGDALFAQQITAGGTHTCALLNDGSVKCWGGNALGQLGVGDETPRGNDVADMGDNLPAVSIPGSVLSISSGYDHTCTLLAGTPLDEIVCWGANFNGQLGIEDNLGPEDRIGDDLTDTLQAIPFALAYGSPQQISVGRFHSCALFADGVRCWGDNSLGQLGQSLPSSNYGIAAGHMSTLNPISFPGGATIVQVECGEDHCCAIDDTAAVYCWGANADYQTGSGLDPNIFVPSLPARYPSW